MSEEIVLSREKMLEELEQWSSRFVDRAMEWRKNSWESNWLRWQRNADSNYDPDLAKKKDKWQSKAVWPITAAHLQNAMAQLFKTEIGPRPPLEVKEAYKTKQEIPLGVDPALLPPPIDQGELIRDLILREREKSGYEINRNMVIQDKCTYGSGFARVRFENKVEDRKIRVPVYEQPSVFDPGSLMRAMSGQQRLLGYEDQVQPMPIYRGVRFEHISIWDFFPDPRSLKIQGSTCAYRYSITYGDVVRGVEEGYYLPEALDKLKDLPSDETTPEDKKIVEAERGISDSKIERTDYGKNLECFEIFARLPKKWVYINGEPIDDPEKLVPAIVRLKKGHCVISVEQNDSYDGEPQIYKDDYLPIAGQFYARGIPELLKDVQLVSSETINQRLDSGSIGLSQRFAVIEQAVFDPKDITENRNTVRLKKPSELDNYTGINQLMARLDMGNPDRTAFVEAQEWERIAQELTSITRATLGTSGQVKDANQTLGGQQMLKEATGDKLAYIGMLSEFGFQREINHAYYKLIYSNYQPEDYAQALGPEKAAQLQLQTPEEIETSYRYVPKGIFEMENKALGQARVSSMVQRYGMMPWFNILGAAKAEIAYTEQEESDLILPEADAIQITQKAGQMAQGMAQQMVAQNEQQKPQPGHPNG